MQVENLCKPVPICPRCHGPAGYVHDCECEGAES
jgi:hypothetical protein